MKRSKFSEQQIFVMVGTVESAGNPSRANRADEAISSAIGSALQGDARSAAAMLRSIGDNKLVEEDRQFRDCMLDPTQHLADLETFPDVEPWELEYRAKLVELALADTTRLKVLQKFIEDQGNDRTSPRSYANRRVLTALASRLAIADPRSLIGTEVKGLQEAASAELDSDTERRLAQSD